MTILEAWVVMSLALLLIICAVPTFLYIAFKAGQWAGGRETFAGRMAALAVTITAGAAFFGGIMALIVAA